MEFPLPARIDNSTFGVETCNGMATSWIQTTDCEKKKYFGLNTRYLFLLCAALSRRDSISKSQFQISESANGILVDKDGVWESFRRIIPFSCIRSS